MHCPLCETNDDPSTASEHFKFRCTFNNHPDIGAYAFFYKTIRTRYRESYQCALILANKFNDPDKYLFLDMDGNLVWNTSLYVGDPNHFRALRQHWCRQTEASNPAFNRLVVLLTGDSAPSPPVNSQQILANIIDNDGPDEFVHVQNSENDPASNTVSVREDDAMDINEADSNYDYPFSDQGSGHEHEPDPHVEKPDCLMSITTSSMKDEMLRNFEHLQELINDMKGYLEYGRQTTSGAITILYQILRFLTGDMTQLRKRLNVFAIITDHAMVIEFMEEVVKTFNHAGTIATKFGHLKTVYHYITMNPQSSFGQKQRANEIIKRLESYSNSRKLRNLGVAETKSRKTIDNLRENGHFASPTLIQRVGNRALRKLFAWMEFDLSQFSNEDIIDFQRQILIAHTCRAICYRSHEYQRMTCDGTTLVSLDDVGMIYQSVITYNKNTSKKGSQMVLWFPEWFTEAIEFFIELRETIAEPDCETLWINIRGEEIDSNFMTNSIKAAFKELDDSVNMNMEKLRFLRSAYIWAKYSKGKISEPDMEVMCRLYDRSLETWEKSYTFTSYIDRLPDARMHDLIIHNFNEVTTKVNTE